jgi:ribosome-binding ATPase YchF (GTP1/OBG family)
MKISVVGKTNVGKTTFFNAATLVDAEIGAFPFTTIKSNMGTAYLRAKCPHVELGLERCAPRNSKCENGVRLVPVAMVDVAGLVPGAHEGRGMGNQFLSDVMGADGLIHVVDAAGATDSEGKQCEPGTRNPVDDVKFLEEEVEYWMEGILKKNWKAIARKLKYGGGGMKFVDAIYEQLSGLNITLEDVENAVKKTGFSAESRENDILGLVTEIRRSAKPIAIAANKMDLAAAGGNLKKLESASEVVVPCCAEAELALRRAAQKNLVKYMPGDSGFEITGEMDEKQRHGLEFIRTHVLEPYKSTGVQDIIDRTVYDLLDMIAVYPVEDEHKYSDKKGNVLPDAYVMKRGTTTLDLAYKVHTDIGEKFKGAVDCRTGKKVGKEHRLQNGDVLRILI